MHRDLHRRQGQGRLRAFGSGDAIRLRKAFLRLCLLLGFLLLPLAAPAASLTCSRMPMLIERFLDSHYALKTVTEEIRGQAVRQMLKGLDPSKTLLYEADVERLKPLLQGLFASMQGGSCVALTQVHELLEARARENEALARKILGPDYKQDRTVELHTNVDKRPYVKTQAEKRELLRRLIQFQIENSLLAGIDLAEAKRQQLHRYELQTKRVVERNPEKLVTALAEAFAGALDPHTDYLSPENLSDLQIQMQLSLEGIGALLGSQNGYAIIEELIPGGGAERSGLLKPKDKIIAVAQEGEKPVDIIDMDLREVIKLIRGKKGTRVTLTILRQAERTERFDATILRDKIDMKEQEAKLTYETRTAGGRTYRFGILELPSFYGDAETDKSSYEDVKRLLAEAMRERVDGVALDLSRNTGGLLKEAVRIAGLFLDRGSVVATKDSRERVTILANGSAGFRAKGDPRRVLTYPAEDRRVVYRGPLVVLTTRMSASASEIVAGALKDYHRAVIVGSDRTFGKGSVQEIVSLPWNLGAIKVTTGLYFLPGGKSTQKIGVEADVALPMWSLLEELGEAELDHPLPPQAISPFRTEGGVPSWRPLSADQLKVLVNRSQARVAGDPKFIEIVQNNREAAAKKGIVRLADLRKEREKENGGSLQETPAERRQKTRDQYAPYLNEGVNVLFDLVTQEAPRTTIAQGTQASGRARD